ncbi:hypothetical protein H4R20_006886, partial [Coemansia guatemalensis]
MSTVVRRSQPNFADWSIEDIVMLRKFVTEHFDPLMGEGIRLASIYMNIRHEDCTPVCSMLARPKITSDLYKTIKQCRDGGMKWKEIHARYSFWRNPKALCNSYYHFSQKSAQKAARGNNVRWTKSETARVKEIIKEHGELDSLKQAIEVAIAEFNDKPEASVKKKILYTHCDIYRGASIRKMEKFRALVDTYGDDWKRIGAGMGLSAEKARYIWAEYEQRLNWTPLWTESETEIIRNCIKAGIKPAEASRLVGTKSIYNCAKKMNALKNP